MSFCGKLIQDKRRQILQLFTKFYRRYHKKQCRYFYGSESSRHTWKSIVWSM